MGQVDGTMFTALSNTSALAETTSLSTPATYQQQVAVTVTIATLGVWCVVGNSITILAIWTKQHMRTKTNVFIISLAFSDLVSGLIASPLWLYRRTWGFTEWKLGQGLCKLYWGTDEATTYCTALHVASFALWRYTLIKWPHRTSRIQRRSVIIWVAVIWIVSIIFGGIIYSSYFAAIDKTEDGGKYIKWPMCSLNYHDDGVEKMKTYYKFTAVTFLMLPMAILLITSVLIAKELSTNKTFKSANRRRKEKRAVAQLAMIAVLFVVGYLPMMAYLIWSVTSDGHSRRLDYWYGTAAYFCLRLSECVNPIAYNAASNRMRKASKEVLVSIWTCNGLRRPQSRYMSGKAAKSIATEATP